MLEAAMNLTDSGIIIIDAGLRIVFCNKWFAERVKTDAALLQGQVLSEAFPRWQDPRHSDALHQALEQGLGRYFSAVLHPGLFDMVVNEVGRRYNVGIKPYSADNRTFILLEIQDGALRQHSSASIKSFIGELAQENKRSQQNEKVARRLAARDSLTGLPNRRDFEIKAAKYIDAVSQGPEMVAVIFIDLDNFKAINEKDGHHSGDQVLLEMGSRLQNFCSDRGTVARYGGDEFVICLPELAKVADVVVELDELMEIVRQPCKFCDENLVVTASLGISLYPVDGVDLSHLLQLADVAMRGVKYSGGDNYSFYSPALIELVQEMGARRAAELAREESESKYYNLFHIMPDGFLYLKLVFDQSMRVADGIVLEVNEAFERIAGVAKESILGKRTSFLNQLHNQASWDLNKIYDDIVVYHKQPRFEVMSSDGKHYITLSFHIPYPGYMAVLSTQMPSSVFAPPTRVAVGGETELLRWDVVQGAAQYLYKAMETMGQTEFAQCCQDEFSQISAAALVTAETLHAVSGYNLDALEVQKISVDALVEAMLFSGEDHLRRAGKSLIRQGDASLPLVFGCPEIISDVLDRVLHLFCSGGINDSEDVMLGTYLEESVVKIQFCPAAGKLKFPQGNFWDTQELDATMQQAQLRQIAWLCKAGGALLSRETTTIDDCITLRLKKA
jgi:diguanylate cyclase (GGDEF)-like protein